MRIDTGGSGTHVCIVSIDTAGNTSAPILTSSSDVFDVSTIMDITAPASSPVIEADTGFDNSDLITSVQTLNVIVSKPAGSTVQVHRQKGDAFDVSLVRIEGPNPTPPHDVTPTELGTNPEAFSFEDTLDEGDGEYSYALVITLSGGSVIPVVIPVAETITLDTTDPIDITSSPIIIVGDTPSDLVVNFAPPFEVINNTGEDYRELTLSLIGQPPLAMINCTPTPASQLQNSPTTPLTLSACGIATDGLYQVSVSYEDDAGNRVINAYPTLVVYDSTAPGPAEVVSGPQFVNGSSAPPTWDVEIASLTDVSLNNQELEELMQQDWQME